MPLNVCDTLETSEASGDGALGYDQVGGALPTGWIRVLIREPQGTLYEDTEARPMTLRTTDTRVDGTYPELLSPQIVSN